jgi:hypothetical protein
MALTVGSLTLASKVLYPHFIAAVSTLIKRWEGPNESWQKVITPIRFERWLTRFRAALFGL